MLTLKRLLKITYGNKIYYFGAMLATVLQAFCSLLMPLVVKFMLDSLIDGQPMQAPVWVQNFIHTLGGTSVVAQNLWLCSLAVILVTSVQGVGAYLKGRWSATASENAAKKMKNNLYDHLQKLPFEYHVKAQTGDLIQRCTSDVETVRRFLSGQMIELARSVFLVAFSIGIMLSLSRKLTLASVPLLPVIFVAALIFFRSIIKQFLKADEKEGELSTILQENLSGVRVVKAFGRQKFETEKFDKCSSEFRHFINEFNKLFAAFFMSADGLSLLQIGMVIVTGVYLAVAGEISIGTFTVFVAYENMLVWPVRNMGRLLADMGKMRVSLGRIFEILNTPEEADTPGNFAAPLDGDVVFDDVRFEYHRDAPVLNGLSFTVKRGETVALLGSTGSGKSTIMHILLRLYDYQSGSVKIGGTELRNINKKWLREKVGIVLQEPFLYSKTIMNNIKMAKAEVEEAEVFDATRTAAVHSVIEEFKEGYETLVGERGVTLSGGQKQRVAIARTLIKNSDILVFDDSLSAVDTETDAQIRQALKERRKGITTFIISQRITTLMQADRIFVLEEGKLADSGTHEDLIARDGLYKRIWDIQSMLEDEVEEAV